MGSQRRVKSKELDISEARPPEELEDDAERTARHKREKEKWFTRVRGIKEIDGLLLYCQAKPTEINGKLEVRWYRLGAVPLAFVEVWEEGHSPSGKWVVHIGSRSGNSGIGFENESEAIQFMIAELNRDISK